MSKFMDAFSGIKYDTEEECQEVVREHLDDYDVEEQLSFIATNLDIVAELRRLGSPLYDLAVEAALDELYDDYVVELSEEDEVALDDLGWNW